MSASRRALTSAALLVLLIGTLFAISIRSDTIVLGQRLEAPPSAADQILQVWLDPYIAFTVILLPCTVMALLTIQREAVAHVQIRTRSEARWLVHCCRRYAKQVAFVLLMWLAVAVATSAGLDTNVSTWSDFSRLTDPASQVLPTVSTLGPSPIAIVIMQGALFGTYLLVVHLIAATFHLLLRRNWVTIVVAAAAYLAQVLTYRSASETILTPSALVFLSSSRGDGHSIVVAFATLAITAGACLLAASAHRRAANVRLMLSPLRSHVAIASFAVLAVVVALSAFRTAATETQSPTFADVLYVAYYGAPQQAGNWLVYMHYALITLGACYLFLSMLVAQLSGRYEVSLLRHGTRLRWMAWMAGRGAALVALAAIVPICITWLTVLATSGLRAATSAHSSLTASTPTLWLYQWVVNGALQLLCICALAAVSVWITGRHFMGVVVLAMFLCAGLLGPTARAYLPVARSGLNYVDAGWAAVLEGTVVLGIWAAAITAAALITVLPRRINFTERS